MKYTHASIIQWNGQIERHDDGIFIHMGTTSRTRKWSLVVSSLARFQSVRTTLVHSQVSKIGVPV